MSEAEIGSTKMGEAERRVREFARRVATALDGETVPTETVVSESLVEQRRGVFRREVVWVPQTVALFDGWLAWGPQPSREYVFRAVDRLGRTTRAIGDQQRVEHSIYLARDGQLIWVETYRATDPRAPARFLHHRSARPAAMSDLGAADLRYRYTNTPISRWHHAWKEWEPVGRRYDDVGVGLSVALRALADRHSVVPRRQKPGRTATGGPQRRQSTTARSGHGVR